VDEILARTPLYDLHKSLGAKIVPFAGYEMPLHYGPGIIAEHLHTRSKAGLFDVSHMGQAKLVGSNLASDLEALMPSDLKTLALWRMRYTVLLNDMAGILDDLMLTNCGDHFFVVANAARKSEDFAHIGARLAGRARLNPLGERALLALQGPAAAAVLGRIASGIVDQAFMSGVALEIAGSPCFVTRSGYTGEDGFEISVPADHADGLARRLLAEPDVMPVGLGARDTLRLEAGLCLYGHDIDETTSPVEADLAWVIPQRRRIEGGFPGAAIVQRQLAAGAARRRVGVKLEDRAPARERTRIVDESGGLIGAITSGGFGPSVGGPIGMGYVETPYAVTGRKIGLVVRGTPRPARIVPLPFMPHHYYGR
jgi:aminomethyltransferase